MDLNCFFSDADEHVDDNTHMCRQPSLMQQLNVELSQKKMIFSKNDIHLSKVVGQGLYNSEYIHSAKKLMFTSVMQGSQG